MLALATFHLSLAEGQILLNRSKKSRKPQTPLLLDLNKGPYGRQAEEGWVDSTSSSEQEGMNICREDGVKCPKEAQQQKHS